MAKQLLGKRKRTFKRTNKRKRRRFSQRAIDAKQNKMIKRIYKTIETKYQVKEGENNITNDLIDTGSTPPNQWNQQLVKLWTGISQGDADNNERIGDTIDVSSVQLKYDIEHDPTDISDSTAFVRVVLFIDNDPVYAKSAIYTPPGPASPQVEENPVGWSQLFFAPLQNDATPMTTLAYRQRDIMKSKRFTMLYDRKHTLVQNTSRQCVNVHLTKLFKNGLNLQYLAAGTQPINKQLYIGYLSNHPLKSAPVITYQTQTLYKDA